jgi:hypothetical protein
MAAQIRENANAALGTSDVKRVQVVVRPTPPKRL